MDGTREKMSIVSHKRARYYYREGREVYSRYPIVDSPREPSKQSR